MRTFEWMHMRTFKTRLSQNTWARIYRPFTQERGLSLSGYHKKERKREGRKKEGKKWIEREMVGMSKEGRGRRKKKKEVRRERGMKETEGTKQKSHLKWILYNALMG